MFEASNNHATTNVPTKGIGARGSRDTAAGPRIRQSTGLRGVLERLLGALMRADQRYRDKRQLEQIDDAALRDVGISRQELDRAFYGKYGRSPRNDAPAPIDARLRS